MCWVTFFNKSPLFLNMSVFLEGPVFVFWGMGNVPIKAIWKVTETSRKVLKCRDQIFLRITF